MCKIDLPRKNMVIERERARRRREGGREAAGNQYTHTSAQMNTLTLERDRKKCWPGWNGGETFSPPLTSSPSH